LRSGDHVPVAATGNLLLYRRQSEGRSIAVALNLGDEPVSIASMSSGLTGEILLSTSLDRRGEIIDGTVDLRSNEGAIIGLTG
jgi:alpha-glucosidase